jgi:hypothetical protein
MAPRAAVSGWRIPPHVHSPQQVSNRVTFPVTLRDDSKRGEQEQFRCKSNELLSPANAK